MKKVLANIILNLVVLCSIFAGDNTAPFTIEKLPSGLIQVSFTPSMTFANLTAINFVLSLPAGVSVASPTFNYGVVAGSSPNEYVSTNTNAGPFTSGVKYPVMTFRWTGGSGTGDFSIVNDGTNYIELSDGAASADRSGPPINNANSVALPIKLKSFTAERYGNARASILNWVSASEINGSHFEIERSIDAQSWAKIGTVNAVGNTTTEVAYEFLDRTIDYARGQDVFYYRLNKVDLDGSSEYTDIRTVRFDPVAEVSVNIYPTLTTGLVRVELASPAGTAPAADAILYDKAGRVINKQEVSTNGITELDLAKYGNGQYFIKMEVNKKVYTTQVIKVN
jgi:hypothetical protein